MDDGILLLKVSTLTESLSNCNKKLSNLQSKYNKEINDLKPDLDQKKSEVKSTVF